MSRKVALILVTIGAQLALYPAAKPATAQALPGLLFVQTAQTIDYKDGVMALVGVPAQTMFFSDRPNRIVDNLPTDAFAANWTTDGEPNAFATFPPNAAVTVFEPRGNPRLDGNDLSYVVKALRGIGPAQPVEGVLFIDNFGYASWVENAFAPPG